MKMRIAAAMVALAMATGASAVTFSSTAGSPDPGPAAGQTTVFDFNGPTPELSGSYSLVTGSVSGVYAAPAGDATQYAVVPMAGKGNGVATLDFSAYSNVKSLSFYWGSIDTYNTVEFLSGGTSIFSLNGSMLPPANGDQGAGLTNRRVYFTFGPGESFDAIRFTSDSVAFEFDDVAIGVPEPASWAMMILGFGMVGFAARRRSARVVAA